MRVLRVHIEAFGRLRDLDSGADPLPEVVVVEGPNEAGKSSFFEALVALLYGFYPASRDTNPWAPWDGATLSLSARLAGADGGCREVHRRLLSTPAGSLVRDEREESLRNRTLPGAEHVPRRVYRQVFALTLAELAGLEGEGWQAVQDRLMGALGTRDLRPPRAVVDELEGEAGSIWRPNRRGRQELRELDVRIRDLGYRRTAVREEERSTRAARAELAELRERLADARTARDQVRGRLERVRREEPVLRRLRRLRELEAEVGDPDELTGLPGDPSSERERRAVAVREAEAARDRLDAAALPAGRRLEAFDDRHRALLEREGELEALGSRSPSDADRARVGQLRQEVADLRRRLRSAVDAVPAWREASEEAFLEPSVTELRRAVDRTRTEPDARRRPFEAALVGAAAIVLLAAAAFGAVQDRALIAMGSLLVSLALGGLALRLGRNRGGTRDPDEVVPDAVARVLGGLPAPPAALLPDLPGILERIQEAVRDLDDRRERRDTQEEALRRADEEALAFVRGLALPGETPDDARAALHLARSEIREAARLRERAEAAKDELERLEGEARLADERLSTAREAREELEARLRELGEDGSVAAGLTTAERRLAALRRSREVRRELDDADPELVAELEARRSVGEHAADRHGDPVSALVARERELGEEIEGLTRRVQALEKDLERLARRETLDLLEGEIASLEEDRERLARNRDRLHLLARLIRDADRAVREEHQPEVLRTAGHHLATLTAGRYDRIMVSGEDARSFLVREAGSARPVPVDVPLSTGTREQVYLALRLALLDPLDRTGERLPLVLDETFVNWDRERLSRGLDLLAEVSSVRQVFLFTCHARLADAAVERTGARRIVLSGP